MNSFEGIPLALISLKCALAITKSMPQNRITVQRSTVPEFFDDDIYRCNGKVFLIVRNKHREIYAPLERN